MDRSPRPQETLGGVLCYDPWDRDRADILEREERNELAGERRVLNSEVTHPAEHDLGGALNDSLHLGDESGRTHRYRICRAVSHTSYSSEALRVLKR
jgi:hypothetical protein